MSYLLKSGADPNPTQNSQILLPLLYTAKFGYDKLLEKLLDYKVPANQQDGFERSALHYAAWFGYSSIINLLLKHKALIDIIDFEGRSPLHFACWFGHKDCVDILIKAGSYIDNQDKGGITPLHFAVMHNRIDIVSILLAAGVNTRLKTNNGKTAESIAVAGNMTEIIELLQKESESSKDGSDENGLPSRKEIMEEHQRMKAIVDKLVESKDMQFEEYTALKETIDNTFIYKNEKNYENIL